MHGRDLRAETAHWTAKYNINVGKHLITETSGQEDGIEASTRTYLLDEPVEVYVEDVDPQDRVFDRDWADVDYLQGGTIPLENGFAVFNQRGREADEQPSADELAEEYDIEIDDDESLPADATVDSEFLYDFLEQTADGTIRPGGYLEDPDVYKVGMDIYASDRDDLAAAKDELDELLPEDSLESEARALI